LTVDTVLPSQRSIRVKPNGGPISNPSLSFLNAPAAPVIGSTGPKKDKVMGQQSVSMTATSSNPELSIGGKTCLKIRRYPILPPLSPSDTVEAEDDKRKDFNVTIVQAPLMRVSPMTVIMQHDMPSMRKISAPAKSIKGTSTGILTRRSLLPTSAPQICPASNTVPEVKYIDVNALAARMKKMMSQRIEVFENTKPTKGGDLKVVIYCNICRKHKLSDII
jgi:hypothetical protein